MKQIKFTDFANVYFTCTGNTCRSPLAAAILEHELAQRGITTTCVQSRAATYAEYPREGGGVVDYTLQVLRERFDSDEFLRGHRARPFLAKDIAKADIIIAMQQEHKEKLLPVVQSPIYTLGEVLGTGIEIQDPLEIGVQRLGDLYRQEMGKQPDPVEAAGWFADGRIDKMDQIMLVCYRGLFQQLHAGILQLL